MDPVDAALRAIAAGLLSDQEALAAEMDAAIFAGAPALAADATLAEETRASTRANLGRWLGAVAAAPSDPVPADVPAEAMDLGRGLVRRGAETDLLLQAYRRGQAVAWRRWMEAAVRQVPEPAQLVEVLDRSSERMFAWVDQVLGAVLAAAQHEREDLLGGELARRAVTVRLLLEGAPIDAGTASARLGYELARRHMALVLWAEPPGQVQGALEATASALAQAAGARRPLLMPSGTSVLWAWLAVGPDADEAVLRAAADGAPPHVRVAVGPARQGVTGFRRSHAAALEVQRLVSGHPDGAGVTTHRDVAVVALAGRDADAAAEFVASVLGDLARDRPQAAVLRETVRVLLAEGGVAPRAAARLHTHRNTVLHRLARAEALLGHPIGEQRLAVALALELAHRLGPQVLTA